MIVNDKKSKSIFTRRIIIKKGHGHGAFCYLDVNVNVNNVAQDSLDSP